MAVPNPRTWIGGVTAFVAATMNLDLRDGLNFLLGRGATCKDYARLVLSTPIPATLTTGVLTAIAFDTEDWDLRGGHSTVSNQSRYVAQETGKYSLRGQVAFAANATGDRQVAVKVNNATYYSNGLSKAATAVTSVPFADDIPMTAGDYVELYAMQNSGGNLALVTPNGATCLIVEWVSV